MRASSTRRRSRARSRAAWWPASCRAGPGAVRGRSCRHRGRGRPAVLAARRPRGGQPHRRVGPARARTDVVALVGRGDEPGVARLGRPRGAGPDRPRLPRSAASAMLPDAAPAGRRSPDRPPGGRMGRTREEGTMGLLDGKVADRHRRRPGHRPRRGAAAGRRGRHGHRQRRGRRAHGEAGGDVHPAQEVVDLIKKHGRRGRRQRRRHQLVGRRARTSSTRPSTPSARSTSWSTTPGSCGTRCPSTWTSPTGTTSSGST